MNDKRWTGRILGFLRGYYSRRLSGARPSKKILVRFRHPTTLASLVAFNRGISDYPAETPSLRAPSG